MLILRHAARLVGDLVASVHRSGSWWLPLIALGLATAAVLSAVVKVSIPTLVYTLF